ncbi:hypothetical protein A3860_39345 [Niastella vici]|uniref:Uncharacterized protein n=1 Tax=Niastella vici TaxID=1703345 RepID=A0A1V9FKE7_9BACT|nr:hypothetical protein A3860_39345 [Niastella vici]
MRGVKVGEGLLILRCRDFEISSDFLTLTNLKIPKTQNFLFPALYFHSNKFFIRTSKMNAVLALHTYGPNCRIYWQNSAVIKRKG